MWRHVVMFDEMPAAVRPVTLLWRTHVFAVVGAVGSRRPRRVHCTATATDLPGAEEQLLDRDSDAPQTWSAA
jgi:hypothetical protein